MYELVTANERSIASQGKTDFTKKLSGLFELIKEEYDTSGASDPKKFMARKTVAELYHHIDREIRVRFGIPIKTMVSEGTPYAVTPIEPRGYNVLHGDINRKIDVISMELQNHTVKCDNLHCLTDFSKQTNDAFTQVLKSHKQLGKIMNTSGFVVDTKKAYIDGLDSEYVVLVLTDPVLLFDIGLTPEEFVAVLLHEIGHAFTALSESTRMVSQTATLLEALGDTHGIPTKERYKILSKRTFGSQAISDSENEEVILLNLLSNLGPKSLSNDVNVSRESERMADQFATRFGHGVELVSALDKMTDYSTIRVANFDHYYLNIRIFLIGILLLGLAGALTMLIVGLIITVAASFIFSVISAAIVGPESGRKETYDTVYKRMLRIKQDYIRQVRMTDNEDFKDTLIKSIKTIDAVMIKHEETPDLMEKIGDIMPWHRNKVSETERQRLLESLIDNTLHIT